MTNNQWIEVINVNRKAIQEAGEEAYKDSMYNQHLQYVIEISQNGSIDTWYQSAGGSGQSMDSYNGNSLVIMTICNQYHDVELTSEQITEALEDIGVEVPEGQNAYDYAYDNHRDVIEQLEQDQLEWEISEYAYDTVDAKIDRCIEELQMHE